MTRISDVERDHPDWEFLAGIDDSESYETDITEIWTDGRSLVLITASGCSCWAGEYGDEHFGTLGALFESLYGIEADRRAHTPTYAGIASLLSQLLGTTEV